MPTIKSALVLTRKHHLGGNLWLFDFDADPPLTWQAGQFVRVELPHPAPDAEGTKRSFTIASAPADRTVQIATRITASTFKQALAALPTGGHLNLLDPPAGDFTWPLHHPVPGRPLVFAAQGIGLTPFRSLIRDSLATGRPTHAHLIHANLTAPAPFAAEITTWTRRDPTLTIHHLTTPLTPAILAKLVSGLDRALVYVSGPHALLSLLAPPYNLTPSQLKQDQFPNYPATNY